MKLFKEFELETHQPELTDLGVKNWKKAPVTVDLSKVVTYYKTLRNSDDEEATLVDFQGADALVLCIKYAEFKTIMDSNKGLL